MRADGRAEDELRPISFELDVQPFAEGSVLITWGRTRVLCAVSLEDRVPAWLQGRGRGWLTAQYAMLPRATSTRNARPGYDGQVKGRSQEIQRFIGRSLRAGLDYELLGERQLRLDCDVIVADGGTRCAAVTGAWVALRLASDRLLRAGVLDRDPILDQVLAVSAGLIEGRPLLDLSADEDQRAEADFNFALAGPGQLIEVQGTAEKNTFDWAQVQELYGLVEGAAGAIRAAQSEALGR